MSELFIGTSGFNYKHWKEIFYPKDLPPSKWLEYYSQHFNSVEINVSFYRLPSAKTFENWGQITPKNFCFALKGSRYITQMKKFKDVEEPLENFFEVASHLSKKLKVVLWQLPPHFKKDLERLDVFCQKLKSIPTARLIDQAFEFRHESWFDDEVYDLLKRYNFALCIADSVRWPTPVVATTDYIYFRFHGSHEIYSSEYSQEELKNIAIKIDEIKLYEKTIYTYFNNDAFGYAISNAETLRDLLTNTPKNGYFQRSDGSNDYF